MKGKNSLEEKKKQLDILETQLEEAYHILGKRTQEFVETESTTINKLVDEIVDVKQSIVAINNKEEWKEEDND